MIWNTSKLSASHLSHATVIFVFDCCQFGPSWIFGLKMELMACSNSVGSTLEQNCLFPDLIWWYQSYEILRKCLHHTSPVPKPFLLFIADKLARAGFLGWKWSLSPIPVPTWLAYNGAKLSFSWPYMMVSMIWNSSELYALHLSRVTAILVVDCCQFGPSWMFGLKIELMTSSDLVGGTMEKICLFPDLIW